MKLNKLIVIILLCAVALEAQLDKTTYYSFGEQVYLEAFINKFLPNDSAEVIVITKIVNDALSFEKINSADPNSKYLSTVTFEYIFKDNQNVIRKRYESLDTHIVRNFTLTESKKDFFININKVILPKGNYTLSLNLNNRLSKLKVTKTAKVNTDKKASDLKPLFIKNINSERILDLEPIAYGGSLPFSSNNTRVIVPISNTLNSDNINYICRKIKDNNEETGFWGKINNLSGSAKVLRKGNFDIHKVQNKYYLDYIEDEVKTTIADFELSSQRLTPGKFELLLFESSSKDTIKLEFNVEWFDKPISLKKIEYAIESMYYIMTDQELDQIESLDEEPKKISFFNYWKKKDPTANSYYNEALVQYYSRVDYTFFNFQTTKEPDGSKTDRGKIYILFGEPEQVTTNFNGKFTQTIWKYPKLGKEFTFEPIESGNFRLVQVK